MKRMILKALDLLGGYVLLVVVGLVGLLLLSLAWLFLLTWLLPIYLAYTYNGWWLLLEIPIVLLWIGLYHRVKVRPKENENTEAVD